jgi:hypothetical protein
MLTCESPGCMQEKCHLFSELQKAIIHFIQVENTDHRHETVNGNIIDEPFINIYNHFKSHTPRTYKCGRKSYLRF